MLFFILAVHSVLYTKYQQPHLEYNLFHKISFFFLPKTLLNINFLGEKITGSKNPRYNKLFLLMIFISSK